MYHLKYPDLVTDRQAEIVTEGAIEDLSSFKNENQMKSQDVNNNLLVQIYIITIM